MIYRILQIYKLLTPNKVNKLNKLLRHFDTSGSSIHKFIICIYEQKPDYVYLCLRYIQMLYQTYTFVLGNLARLCKPY